MTWWIECRLDRRSEFLVLFAFLLLFACNFRERVRVRVRVFCDRGGDESVPRHANRVNGDKAAVVLGKVWTGHFLGPRLEFWMNVEFSIDMVHIVVPDHLIAEETMRNEFTPVSFEMVAIVEYIESENGVSMPGDLASILLVRIGISEALG